MGNRIFFLSASLLTLMACSQSESEAPSAATQDVASAVEDKSSDVDAYSSADLLAGVLDAQSDDAKARYQYRHPQETLTFFGVEPGMKVVDTLPGNPWYSGILLDYLGPDGVVVGADYSAEMWTQFGQFSPDPATKETWSADWIEKANSWRDSESDAQVDAFAFGAVPDELKGTVDVVLQIRTMHHFNRMETEYGYQTEALQDMMDVLKPGGVVGVVLHRAPEENSDEWALGNAGYVKQSAMIAAFEAGGFEFVEASEINANPADKPTENDFVWRLPPALATSDEDPELRAAMIAIGESDRMTLKFKKPE